jgi:hypothetical protein
VRKEYGNAATASSWLRYRRDRPHARYGDERQAGVDYCGTAPIGRGRSGGKEATQGLSQALLDVREIVDTLKTIDDHQQERMNAVNVGIVKVNAARSRYHEWAQNSSANVSAKLKRLREYKP